MVDDNPVTLRDCVSDAVATLNAHLDQDNDPWNGNEDQMIHEIADGRVPLFPSVILRIADEEPEVGLVAPEHAYYDGTFTPVNVAAANIYEIIQKALWERLKERKAEKAA